MISILARVIFITALVSLVLFFTLGLIHLKIETNLNDLNPTKVADKGLKFATDALTQDISHRFIIVIKGPDTNIVSSAVAQMQAQLNDIDNLLILSNESIQTSYLSVLSPYRFNLLSEQQRLALDQSSVDELAKQATRKLYQLGDGVRLIPFEQDPLGWFSDYLITQLGDLEFSKDTKEAPKSDDAVNTEPFESFAVAIQSYPSSMAQQQNLYQRIKDIESDISQDFAVTVLHSGMFFFAVDSAQSAKSDIQLIAIGSIVGVLVLMLMVFRSLLPLFLSLSSIAIGVGFGVLVSTLVFGSIHILTIVFGASLIGIVVDYSLHYFYHFLSHKQDAEKASRDTNTLKRAMFLSVLTSLIGYGALTLSDLLILKKVALFSCSGLLMAWLGVMVLGPLVTKRPIVARQALLKGLIKGIQAIFATQPKVLISIGLGLACLGGVSLLVFEANTNDDPRRFFHVSPNLLSLEQQVAGLTEVYEPGRYLIAQGESAAQVYQGLEALYRELGSNSNQVSSVLDWLPSSTAQQQDYALQKTLYQDDGVVDTFFTGLGMSVSQASSVKAAYVAAKGRVLDFDTLKTDLPSLPPLWVEYEDRIFSFVLIRKDSDLASIEMAAQDIASIQYVNTLGTAMASLKAQRVTGSQLLTVAYALIAIMLALYYRKLSAVLLLLIPIVASVITLSTIALIGQPITVFHIMALFLVLGLGMDYIIFAKEMNKQRAITQQAILLSAVTSLLSFGLLAFSSMPIVQAFGSTILIGNSINFIAAISLFNTPPIQEENSLNVDT